MKLSKFGDKFTRNAGILSLMDDLGQALSAGGENLIMMGGGNPSHIPEVEELFRERLRRIVDDRLQFRRLTGIYDPPQGKTAFIADLAALLRREYGWPLTPANIALTNGSQSAFFMLFNMLAGECADGSRRTIHFPLTPEYIGYADAGLCDSFFTAGRPRIELIGDDLFKYRVDFADLRPGPEVAALCASRPTNPTGNVLTDAEVAQLAQLAHDADIPLILDGAYGAPFPNLMFTEATPFWNEDVILLLSLSKLGLPAARTGIVIAAEEVIRALAAANAVLNLSTGSFGPMLTDELIASGDILHLSNETVRPYYQQRAQLALTELRRCMDGTPFRAHAPEGAMFLWLWFENLPITSLELYQRLKNRGVIVVSGHYFFPGLTEDWRHRHECLRVTYTQDEEKVKRGLAIIAEEVKRAYAQG